MFEAVGPTRSYESTREQRPAKHCNLSVAKALQQGSVEQPQRHSQRRVQIQYERGVKSCHVKCLKFIFENQAEARQDGDNQHL